MIQLCGCCILISHAGSQVKLGYCSRRKTKNKKQNITKFRCFYGLRRPSGGSCRRGAEFRIQSAICFCSLAQQPRCFCSTGGGAPGNLLKLRASAPAQPTPPLHPLLSRYCAQHPGTAGCCGAGASNGRSGGYCGTVDSTQPIYPFTF